MAEKILRNEAYMDDACFSAFTNLHKAAKRKSNYIWSDNKFSLDSIWSDYAQPKTSEVPDDTSGVRNGSRNESVNSKVVCSSNKARSKTSQLYSYLKQAEKESLESEQITNSDENEATLHTHQNATEFHEANDGEEMLSWKCQISLVFKAENNVGTSLQVKNGNNDLKLKGDKNEEQRNRSRKSLEKVSAERKAANCYGCPSEKVPFSNAQELSNWKDSSRVSPKIVSNMSNCGSPAKFGNRDEIYHHDSELSSDKYVSNNATFRREDDAVNQHKNLTKTFSHMKTNDQAEKHNPSDSKDSNHFSVEGNKDVRNKNISVSQSNKSSISQGSNFSRKGGISNKLTDKMIFDDVSESQKGYLRSKVNDADMDQNEKTTQRTKRTRHSSGASTSSAMPAQKKSTFKTKNATAQLSPSAKNDLFKTILCVEIMKGEQYFQIFVDASDFYRIKNKFPKLQEVFPDMNGKKEIKYCLEAVKVVFRSMLNPAFNFNNIPEGKIAMEILAATESWEIIDLHKKFQKVILKKISRDNFNVTYPAAIHFGLSEICAAYKKLLPDNESPSDNAPYRQRNCFVSISVYVEPLEFCIPLHAASQSLHDQFPRDLSNEIIFEAVKGDYVIKGFHILLNTTHNRNNDAKHLDVFYSIQNLEDTDESEQMKITKPLSPNIVIHFRRKITVLENQKAEIVIDTNISPYLCMATETNSLAEKREEKEFILNFSSNFKVENSNEKRFLVKKLLYYPKNETS